MAESFEFKLVTPPPSQRSKAEAQIPYPDPSQETDVAVVPARKRPVRRFTSNKVQKEELTARNEQIMLRRLCGMRVDELTREFNLSKTQIERVIQQQKEAGYLVSARNKIVELLPKAIAVLDVHLQENVDLGAALEVLKGVGLLNKTMKIEAQPNGTVETFEEFRRKYTKITPKDEPPQLEAQPVIDIIIEDNNQQLQ